MQRCPGVIRALKFLSSAREWAQPEARCQSWGSGPGWPGSERKGRSLAWMHGAWQAGRSLPPAETSQGEGWPGTERQDELGHSPSGPAGPAEEGAGRGPLGASGLSLKARWLPLQAPLPDTLSPGRAVTCSVADRLSRGADNASKAAFPRTGSLRACDGRTRDP